MILLPHTFNHISSNIMNKSTLIGMLRQGNTGEQILNILDAIANNNSEEIAPAEQLAYGTILTWDGREVAF